jgi:hypothetical protein
MAGEASGHVHDMVAMNESDLAELLFKELLARVFAQKRAALDEREEELAMLQAK